LQAVIGDQLSYLPDGVIGELDVEPKRFERPKLVASARRR
jgi:hypothetical protein